MVSERTWVWQLMNVHAGTNNPWSWDSVTDAVRADLIERLPVFVADYNRLYVTKPSQLVPRCWPLHPALARQVAVLYATWLASFHEQKGALRTMARTGSTGGYQASKDASRTGSVKNPMRAVRGCILRTGTTSPH